MIGGGRWGWISSRVLARMNEWVSAVHLVSRHTPPPLTAQFAGDDSVGIQLTDDLPSIIKDPSIKIAVVANLPDLHYATTRELLAAGKHVLVEKPFVLSPEHGAELIDLAGQRNLTLAVGLEFMLSPSVHAFKKHLGERAGEIAGLDFLWQDVFSEERHGATKFPGLTINVFADLLPHILSMLDVLSANARPTIEQLTIEQGGFVIAAELSSEGMPVRVNLSRVAAVNKRHIKVRDAAGQEHVLDFTVEPGRIHSGAEEFKLDELIETNEGSLDIEYRQFFETVAGLRDDIPFAAKNTIGFVEVVEHGLGLIASRQADIVSPLLTGPRSGSLPQEAVIVLREHILFGLLDRGLVTDSRNFDEIDPWVETAFEVMGKTLAEPNASRGDLIEGLNIDSEQFDRLREIIGQSDFCRRLTRPSDL